MLAEPVSWSPEKQARLQLALVGPWAEDVWNFSHKEKRYCESLSFDLTSSSLKTEVKYALWRKFDDGKRKLESDQHRFCSTIRWLLQWLNHQTPPITSLLERSLDFWEVTLRSDLVNQEQFRPRKSKRLLATQEYRVVIGEDERIPLLRALYTALQEAYDERPETEKDVWDMRKMGLKLNPTRSDGLLNFTQIVQPWLLQLAKEYLKYETALHSPACCQARVRAIQSFSQFLAQQAPLRISEIDRSCIVSYLSYLRNSGVGVGHQRNNLMHLRAFLEGCVYQLSIPGLPKERLIFDEDLPRQLEPFPREIPEEVLDQLRQHLEELPTLLLRMVTVLLEVGMRISELCTLPLDCLRYDDQHEWYLQFYLWKRKKDHTVPLVSQIVIGAIQAQQEEIKARWGQECPYLFPSTRSPKEPYRQASFRDALNEWALKTDIRDRVGHLYRFTPHQFRHTVGMRLLNEDVPLDTISRLFGHASLRMTQYYAQKRLQTIRAELQRIGLKHKTINFQGLVVKGDVGANGVEPQLLRKGIRGQTLPVGGCGRPVVSGPCDHENKCLTCVFWLTSTEDLPTLKAFLDRAIRLRQRAAAAGSQIVVANQDRIIPLLQLRVASLEAPGRTDEMISVNDLLRQLKRELAELEEGLEEAYEAQLVIAVKQLERRISELKIQIAALEGTA